VDVEIKKDSLIFSSENMREELEGNFGIDDTSFSINPNYLKQALILCDTFSICKDSKIVTASDTFKILIATISK